VFKIAGGIILAVIGLYLLAIFVQLLPIAIIMAPDLLRSAAKALTPTAETVYSILFLVIAFPLLLWLLSRPFMDGFRRWLNNGKPSWR
jgi:hypothetical protein